MSLINRIPSFEDVKLPECEECEQPILTQPVTDPDDVAWRGYADARKWCSQECLQVAAERWWLHR